MKKWYLPLLALGLCLLGLVTLSSVSPDLMRRQLIFVLVSFAGFWLVAQFPFRYWWRWGDWLWKGLVVILIGLLLFGRVTRGAAAWIDLGWGLRFQPSQFALMIALWKALPKFAKQRPLADSELVEFLWLLLVPAVLIALQPDFGTMILYCLSLLPLVLWQKLPKRYWQAFLISVFAISVIGWNFVLKPYQQARITNFLAGSQTDASNAGYNARQALIAVGAGQWLGRGLGHGTQSQLRFLPERQTDFIFASLAEEWGLIGALAVIGLYLALILFLLMEARRHHDPQPSLWLAVTAVYFLAQVLVNIGMNIGLLPITGVTLPLVSYGGSSLLATMLLLGVAQRLVQTAPAPPHRRIS